MPAKGPPVKVDVFEGPLDLLLHLIEEEQVDIYDIPIARITEQYLEYLHAMEELDLEIASEFLVMAATLIEIKARMLLPRPAAASKEPDEGDPRKELVDMLLEYRRLKEAARELRRRWEEQSRRAFRAVAGLQPAADRGIDLGDIRLFDLARQFRMLLNKARPAVSEIARESFSVRRKMRYILRQLSRAAVSGAVTFSHLVSAAVSRQEIVVTFLALLELVKRRRVRVDQERLFGEVTIRSAGASPGTPGGTKE